jgi:hypothetical protein
MVFQVSFENLSVLNGLRIIKKDVERFALLRISCRTSAAGPSLKITSGESTNVTK